MMDQLDIHNSKKRIEYARASLRRKFSAENANTACEFLDRLKIENRSLGRIANYAECTRRILNVKDDKRISEWTRKDIESIYKAIADTNYQNSVKKDILTALKRLYHFSLHNELADQAKGKDYDPNVSWITPSCFKDRYEKIQAKDLLTDLELEKKGVRKVELEKEIREIEVKIEQKKEVLKETRRPFEEMIDDEIRQKRVALEKEEFITKRKSAKVIRVEWKMLELIEKEIKNLEQRKQGLQEELNRRKQEPSGTRIGYW